MIRLLIWGTGKAARAFCENETDRRIVGFIETNKSREIFRDIPVYGIDEKMPDYDYIIVANTYTDEIYRECVRRGIDLSKIIFLYPAMRAVGETNLDIIRSVLRGENYVKYCKRYGLFRETFFMEDLHEYQAKNTRNQFAVNEKNLWPVIVDRDRKAGMVGNYFWQDLWAAKLVIGSGTKKHFDIGSRIDGFIAHLLAAEIDVTMIDIREFPEEVEKLHTIVDNATLLQQIQDNSIESMSALCSLEHFGLGRYGDPIDPEACFKCFDRIQKKLKRGGRLYISLPVGRERLEFNAHRVFYPSTVVQCFGELCLEEFSCTSQGKLEQNVGIHQYDEDPHDGEWRYGLFYFIKR